jgi:hypothetical protein
MNAQAFGRFSSLEGVLVVSRLEASRKPVEVVGVPSEKYRDERVSNGRRYGEPGLAIVPVTSSATPHPMRSRLSGEFCWELQHEGEP